MNASRRKFIKNTGVAISGIAAFPMILKANQASPKIVVGLIGCGNSGNENLKSFLKKPNTECAAICDINQNSIDKTINFIQSFQNSKPSIYSDYRYLLENKKVNVIINAAPRIHNYNIAKDTMRAGKNLFTKNLYANNLDEAEKLLAIQKQSQKLVLVKSCEMGEQLKMQTQSFLRTGALGCLNEVQAWLHQPVANINRLNQESFAANYNNINLKTGACWINFVNAVLGKKSPISVMATGGNFHQTELKTANPDLFMAVYDFGDCKIIWDYSIGTNRTFFNRNEGLAFRCQKGILLVHTGGLEIIRENSIKKIRIDEKENELDYQITRFIHAIQKAEKVNPGFERVIELTKPAFFANLSYKTGKRIYWDNFE